MKDDPLPYPDDPGQTHYAGCYRARGHHNCAVALIEEQGAELRIYRNCLHRSAKLYAEMGPNDRMIFPDGAQALAKAMDELAELKAKQPVYPTCPGCGTELHYQTCGGLCVQCMAKDKEQ
jgi:hypothetical protein